MNTFRGSRVAVGALAITVVLAGCGSGVRPDSEQAIDFCQQDVADELVSPSSAKFFDVAATETGELAWTVAGQVEGSNALGVLLRSGFTCDAVRDGDQFRTQITDLELS